MGIRFTPDEHWHVYWKNPGDSGAAPKFQFKSETAQVGDILWPYPKRLPVAHLTNLGYEGATSYLFRVKTENASGVAIEAKLEWLVCREECIPGFGTLRLERPAEGAEAVFATPVAAEIAAYAARLPVSGTDSSHTLRIDGGRDGELDVAIEGPANAEIELFPLDGDFVSPARPAVKHADGRRIATFQTAKGVARPERVGFLLVADGQAYEFPAPPTGGGGPAGGGPYWILILSALVGGALLNFMPCVFPVISMKALSLLKISDPAGRRRDGWLYSAGVVTAFTALGAAVLALRSAGAAVGWGFQLQSPLVVLSLVLLFWLMALNFLGVFETGAAVMSSAGKMNWRSAFGTGVLSVFIAAPCTGPFMGAALGATAALPGPEAMAIFMALGSGLALPYLLLTMNATLARRLPRSGPWMETLKQFFAFPLFATVLWLLWVLGSQTGPQGWLIGSSTLLAVSFCVWLGRRTRRSWIAWLLAIGAVAGAGGGLRSAKPAAAGASTDWEPYSANRLEAVRKEGRPVFIDFTAAWCITCQVNKAAVLETEEADALFEGAGILRLRADWTRQDPGITAALAGLGRNSVPVYAYYPAAAEPRLLPQILTLDMIRELATHKEERQ